MKRSSKAVGALALTALLGSSLAGCSEYLDRRETISLNGGNAVAQNSIVQMVDPWPRASANRNIAFDGNVMESAVRRYRTGQVIPPRGIGTSSSYNASPAPGQAQNNSQPLGPTVTQPVK